MERTPHLTAKRCRLLPAAVVALCCLAAASSGVADVKQPAGLEKPAVELDETGPGRQAAAFFDSLEEAWRAADHEALAALVDPEGMLACLAPERERENRYGPNQAFYFFRNLFQSTTTREFDFARWRRPSDRQELHAIADWSFERKGTAEIVEERIFFSLRRFEDTWVLVELRALR